MNEKLRFIFLSNIKLTGNAPTTTAGTYLWVATLFALDVLGCGEAKTKSHVHIPAAGEKLGGSERDGGRTHVSAPSRSSCAGSGTASSACSWRACRRLLPGPPAPSSGTPPSSRRPSRRGSDRWPPAPSACVTPASRFFKASRRAREAERGRGGTTKGRDSRRSDVRLTEPVRQRQAALLPLRVCPSGDLLLQAGNTHTHTMRCSLRFFQVLPENMNADGSLFCFFAFAFFSPAGASVTWQRSFSC